jgi:hypothetical protein
MVRSNLALAVLYKEEGEVGLSDSNVIAGIHKASFVRDEQPPARENGPSFKFVHGRRPVPGRRQSFDRLRAVIFVRLWSYILSEPAGHGDLVSFFCTSKSIRES